MYKLESLKKRGGGSEKLVKKIMAEDFLNLMETVHSQIQEAQRTPNMRIMKKKHTKAHHHQIVQAVIEKNLKSNQRKKAHYIQRNKEKYDRFLVRNNPNEKTIE